jgi:hypothetical protein
MVLVNELSQLFLVMEVKSGFNITRVAFMYGILSIQMRIGILECYCRKLTGPCKILGTLLVKKSQFLLEYS